MALPNDPRLRTTSAPRSVAIQDLDLCLMCFGAGQYLEPVDGGHSHEYLPVVCDGCNGCGHRTV